MKILQLRFKNLNSLAGEWLIDFTSPEYVSDGIFAISGPTGAGKSTIMDAICLALYGKTPRLRVISQNNNEIMSRHTGECFSEVVFETQKGQFRCTWSQHRAGKKAGRNLQDAKHEIADAITGKILESKKTEVSNAIIARTGMDFSRFTQSMMLAQGGFAAFLNADPEKERAPILEQITGTEIYSEISILVFDRRRTEFGKLEILKSETEGILILNEEQENSINQELIEKQTLEKEFTLKKSALDQCVQWLNRIEKLNLELNGILAETVNHSIDLQNFESNRLLLQKGLKAEGLEVEFTLLSSKRAIQLDELNCLSDLKLSVPQKKTVLDEATGLYTDVNNSLVEIKQQSSVGLEEIKAVRALDIQSREKEITLKREISTHKELLSAKIEKIKEKKSLRVKVSVAWVTLGIVEDYFSKNISDSELVTELTGIREKLSNLGIAGKIKDSFSTQLLESEKLLRKAEREYMLQEELNNNLGKELSDAIMKRSLVQQTLIKHLADRQLREYRADLAHLNKELVYLQKIGSLESERKQLTDNQPCPLCGSLHHPFAEGNIQEPDETGKKIHELSSFIELAEKLEESILVLENEEKIINTKLIAVKMELQTARYSKESSEKILNQNIADQKYAIENYSNLLTSTAIFLQPFGITDLANINPDEVFSALEAKLSNWQNQLKKRKTIEDQISSLTSGIETINALIISKGDSLKTKLKEIILIRTELEKRKAERERNYGTKNPDSEELRLKKLVATAEMAERSASDKVKELTRELAALNPRIDELNKTTSLRKITLDIDEIAFRKSIEKAGFNDEAAFINCRVSTDRKEELSQKATALDRKTEELKTRKKDREDQLVQEAAKRLTQESVDSLILQQNVVTDSISSILKEIGAKMQQLEENEKARERFGQITLLFDAQKAEFQRWDLLSNLIGSADGKKYRNFAQGLTFEIMVAHANTQLIKLTDRYLLIRDKDQPLDLDVIDNYQAGEIRSTKNLSGGETFIVSLALALGLSKMASKNVRVDSLFLDEGFGTLDEDTLETALETLASLRQDGKLIGVISHVTALKERIATKILVEKYSGGKSRLSGPGCRQIY